MAIQLGHPLKDCLYLALAMELGCDLVTCDARFAAKAKGVWAGVRVLGGGDGVIQRRQAGVNEGPVREDWADEVGGGDV